MMTVDELIVKLQAIQPEHGHLPVIDREGYRIDNVQVLFNEQAVVIEHDHGYETKEE